MNPPPAASPAEGEASPHRDYLYAIADRELAPSLRRSVSPSEIVQETYLRAHRARDRFEGDEPGQLRAWLATILRNLLHNCRRDLGRRPGHVALDPGLVADAPSPSEVFAEAERAAGLDDALQTLPDGERLALKLHDLEALPFAAIAERLGVSETSARRLYARALLKTRARLGGTS